MSTNRQHILDLCIFISKRKNLRCVPNQKFKIAAITLAAVIVGGLVGGPRGLAAGATAAAVGAGLLSGQGKALNEILKNDLTEITRDKLVDAMWGLICEELMESRDFNEFVEKIINNLELEELVITELKKFVIQEMDMAVI